MMVLSDPTVTFILQPKVHYLDCLSVFKSTVRNTMAQEDRLLFWSRVNEVHEKWIESVEDNILASGCDETHNVSQQTDVA